LVLRKRYYIFFVTRDAEGEIRKIPIPLHYLYVFLAGAVIGMFTITGMAGSYARMLVKTAQFNTIRQEKNAIKTQYHQLEQVAQEKEIQVASLGSLASEVSALYGLKSDPTLATVSANEFTDQHFSGSIDQLYTLKASAYNGAASAAVSFGAVQATASDWQRFAAAPSLWPVEGPVTGSFGERSDPFSGEGAFHMGIDISSSYGNPVIAPADGVVTYANDMSGYGHVVMIDHGHGISTRFGHLSGFTVASGQSVRKGETIGYVGLSGRSTGPHLHYEVRIYDTPVNPYKYLRTTLAQSQHLHTGM
jgi:murein DD-endopeptidase MepM/ murein hydrolase activator NlpD